MEESGRVQDQGEAPDLARVHSEDLEVVEVAEEPTVAEEAEDVTVVRRRKPRAKKNWTPRWTLT